MSTSLLAPQPEAIMSRAPPYPGIRSTSNCRYEPTDRRFQKFCFHIGFPDFLGSGCNFKLACRNSYPRQGKQHKLCLRYPGTRVPSSIVDFIRPRPPELLAHGVGRCANVCTWICTASAEYKVVCSYVPDGNLHEVQTFAQRATPCARRSGCRGLMKSTPLVVLLLVVETISVLQCSLRHPGRYLVGKRSECGGLPRLGRARW